MARGMRWRVRVAGASARRGRARKGLGPLAGALAETARATSNAHPSAIRLADEPLACPERSRGACPERSRGAHGRPLRICWSPPRPARSWHRASRMASRATLKKRRESQGSRGAAHLASATRRPLNGAAWIRTLAAVRGRDVNQICERGLSFQ